MTKRNDGRKPRAAPRSAKRSGTASPDWQDEIISHLRRLIQAADPAAIEEQKWRKPSNPEGVPAWSHNGIMCTVQALKNRVRITFGDGAQLKDGRGLFNACLEAGHMRGIDIHEGEDLDEEGIKSLVRAAAALNASTARR
jgi:hypothetical protein